MFCVLSMSINGQIVKYKANKVNTNLYDNDMQTYKGWNGWNNDETDCELAFSQNAFKIGSVFANMNFDPNHYVNYFSKVETIYTFMADEPIANFPFRKKISIKYTNRVLTKKSRIDEDIEKITTSTGKGYIYSNETFDKILSGNSIADIYIFYEMEDGSKGYKAYNIKSINAIANDAAAEQRQIEQEEAAAERERLKREKRSETINSLGSSIIKLLKK